MKKVSLTDKAVIIKNNITSALILNSRSERIIKSQIYELALCAAEEGLSPADAADMYKDTLSKICENNYLAQFCRFFCDALRKSGHTINPPYAFYNAEFSDFPYSKPLDVSEDTPNFYRIAYVENSYSDKAFRRFRVALGAIEAVPAQNFENACEDVENGIADGCILPVYNDKDGIMMSFKRLAAKYGLKTSAQCRIPMSDGDTETFFSLMGRTLPKNTADTNIIEVSVNTGKTDIAELIKGASFLGALTERIDTLPLGYDTYNHVTNIIFRFLPEHSGELFMFLSAMLPLCEPEGIYKIL